jgi:hypothetical protein
MSIESDTDYEAAQANLLYGANTKLPVCCRCADSASLLCSACELVYCASCHQDLHKKGSFVRHQKGTDLSICEECEKSVAALRCEDCDMRFCRDCSSELHSKGSMRFHEKAGSFVPFFQQKMQPQRSVGSPGGFGAISEAVSGAKMSKLASRYPLNSTPSPSSVGDFRVLSMRSPGGFGARAQAQTTK